MTIYDHDLCNDEKCVYKQECESDMASLLEQEYVFLLCKVRVFLQHKEQFFPLEMESSFRQELL